MALTDESNGTNMVMPVSPMYGNGGGFGFGNDGGWWIILFLFAMFGGWGNGFGGGFGGFDGGLYPWMNQANQTNNGFRDQMLNSSIQGIQSAVTSGFGDVQLGIAGINQNLCQTGNGIINAVNSGFANAEVAANARQMADMQQAFNSQIATMQGFNGVQSQLANCCCENRAGIADLKYTVAAENCADRTAAAQNTRDIIDSQTRGTQAILDKLCQLELDSVKAQVEAKNDRIAELQSQLNMAALRESQTAQNAFISQGFANEVDQLYNRLNSCPVPSTPVYGKTPIFTCSQQNGSCGCGSY